MGREDSGSAQVAKRENDGCSKISNQNCKFDSIIYLKIQFWYLYNLILQFFFHPVGSVPNPEIELLSWVFNFEIKR